MLIPSLVHNMVQLWSLFSVASLGFTGHGLKTGPEWLVIGRLDHAADLQLQWDLQKDPVGLSRSHGPCIYFP